MFSESIGVAPAPGASCARLFNCSAVYIAGGGAGLLAPHAVTIRAANEIAAAPNGVYLCCIGSSKGGRTYRGVTPATILDCAPGSTTIPRRDYWCSGKRTTYS